MARNRKQTERYGEIQNFESSTEVSDPFADNSLDDSLYEPSPKRPKIVRDYSDSSSITSEESTQKKNQMPIENFDLEFDSIKESSEKVYESSQVHLCKPAFENTDSILHKSNENNVGSSELIFIRESLGILLKNSAQIMTRIEIFEKSAMKNGNLITLKEENDEIHPFHEYNAFTTSQKLPIDNMTDMDRFEKGLDDAKLRKEAVIFLNFFRKFYFPFLY